MGEEEQREGFRFSEVFGKGGDLRDASVPFLLVERYQGPHTIELQVYNHL
jgi:hypothetical protein